MFKLRTEGRYILLNTTTLKLNFYTISVKELNMHG